MQAASSPPPQPVVAYPALVGRLEETDTSGLPVWRRDDNLDLTGLPVWAPASA